MLLPATWRQPQQLEAFAAGCCEAWPTWFSAAAVVVVCSLHQPTGRINVSSRFQAADRQRAAVLCKHSSSPAPGFSCSDLWLQQGVHLALPRVQILSSVRSFACRRDRQCLQGFSSQGS